MLCGRRTVRVEIWKRSRAGSGSGGRGRSWQGLLATGMVNCARAQVGRKEVSVVVQGGRKQNICQPGEICNTIYVPVPFLFTSPFHSCESAKAVVETHEQAGAACLLFTGEAMHWRSKGDVDVGTYCGMSPCYLVSTAMDGGSGRTLRCLCFATILETAGFSLRSRGYGCRPSGSEEPSRPLPLRSQGNRYSVPPCRTTCRP